VAWCKVISRIMPGRTRESHVERNLGQPGLEPETLTNNSRIGNHETTTFDKNFIQL
jgi:hypothetical protein